MYQVIYTKYSNERAEEFSLFTKILENEYEKKFVVKIPETRKGRKHIENIKKFYIDLMQIYEKKGICLNRCELNDRGLKLEYLKGETYESLVDDVLIKKGKDAAIKMIHDYIDLVIVKEELSEFKMTKDFEKVFGKIDVPLNQMSLSITDIDAIMSNMICNEEKYYLIDYEWTFYFPIPVKYIIYRIIHYYIECNSIREEVKESNIYEENGLTEQEIKIFEQMERNFQLYIQGNRIPVRNMYQNISPGCFQVQEIVQEKITEKAERQLQIYFSYGEGYSEKNSKTYSFNDKSIDSWFDVPVGVTDIRIDPGTKNGICLIESLSTKQDDVVIPFSTNGHKISDNMILFDNDDPYFAIVNYEKIEKLHIAYKMERVSMKSLKKIISDYNVYEVKIKDILGKIDQYKNELCTIEEELEESIEENKLLQNQLNEIKWWEIIISKILKKILHIIRRE